MLFAGRCFGPSLPLVWRVFLTNAAMLTAATLALALSPATVSFPLALTEAVVLGGGLAATLSLDLVLLRRALGSPPAPALREVGEPRRRAVVPVLDPALPAEWRGRGRQAGTRLLVGWSRPHHLSDTDAAAWAEAEVREALAATGTGCARFTRMDSASARYARPWDWLLELELEQQRDPREYVESPPWRVLLGDLRQLGLRPGAMVAEAERVVRAERD